ncbi:MAG: CoA-binding protein [Gemmatimonadetes bacterium]|nr:CoA-binding protein [Gemmatimonadota bacterium]
MSESDWQANLIEDSEGVRRILRDARRIAVLGIKTEAAAGQPAYYVPRYLQQAGYEIVPVPVYYPDATEILGARVYRTLAEIPGEIDLVNVFRRPQDLPPHVDDIISAAPKAVWMQSGIRNAEVARRLAAAGIQVVQDRCAMVEHRWIGN